MVQYPPDWYQLSSLGVAHWRFPAIMPSCLGGDRTGRSQSGSKFGPLYPSLTAHTDRSNIQLGTIHHCLVVWKACSRLPLPPTCHRRSRGRPQERVYQSLQIWLTNPMPWRWNHFQPCYRPIHSFLGSKPQEEDHPGRGSEESNLHFTREREGRQSRARNQLGGGIGHIEGRVSEESGHKRDSVGQGSRWIKFRQVGFNIIYQICSR